jgi:hypothetical protein
VATVFGHVLTLTSNQEKNSETRVQIMDATLPALGVSVKRTTMVIVANTGMSAQLTRTVVLKASVSTIREPLCQNVNVIASWDSLDQDVIKVSWRFSDIWLFLNYECLYLFCFLLESPIKSTDIDYSMYKTKTLSPDYKIFWRILKEQKEIEIIMVVNGTTWAGLGWRSRKLTADCKNFPIIREYGQTEEVSVPAAEPAAEPTAEPTAEPAPEPETEPNAEPEPTKEPAAEPNPNPSAEPGPVVSSQKRKRKAKATTVDESTSKQGITVSTSVSYKVSAKSGRRKRAFTLGSKYSRRL